MFFKELWQMDPIKVFFDTTANFSGIPGIQSNSKIVIFLENVAPVLHKKVSSTRPYIQSLLLKTLDSNLRLEGSLDSSSYWIAKILGIRSIHYRVDLKIVQIEGNVVRFRIQSYSLRNPDSKKWDMVNIFSRWDRIHKTKILKAVTESYPAILRLTPIRDEVLFNLNYYLGLVPSLAGKIQVVSADLQNDRVVFHARSNVILKPLMDLLGPEYVKVTYREAGKYY